MPRYARFTLIGRHRWGTVVDDPSHPGEWLQPLVGSPWDGGTPAPAGEPLAMDTLRLDVPTTPTKIVCVGRNYVEHAKELGHEVPTEPLIFLKPPSSLLAHEGAIVYPRGKTELVHHEGELAIVIGRTTKDVSEADAPAHIFGYSVLNDVTARDLQRKDVQFTRGKGFDTFCPIGPWVDTDFVPAAQRLVVEVDGEVRQSSTLDLMIFKIPFLVSWISRHMTLERGDVIATGTPAGVGPLVPGNVVTVSIEGLGTLRNTVV